MKILLLEYITAGGLNDVPLPASLLREGILMRDALLKDFGQLEEVEVVTTCDARITLPAPAPQTVWIDQQSKPMKIWQELLQVCDAALVIAPENDGILSALTKIVDASKVKNLGCSQYAIDTASSKHAVYQTLKNANILTIPTYRANELLKSNFIVDASFKHGYVVKPNDGAGCSDTMYFSDFAVLLDWIKLNPEKQANNIIQPFQTGIPASISVLCKNGQAWVLSCNQQMILIETKVNQASIQYQGSVVNGITDYQASFEKLANCIAKSLSGLNGYIGIDVIINGEAVYVVEINPRITTSYIGLHESLNYNPAQLILDLIGGPSFTLPENLANKLVEISVNGLDERKLSCLG